MALITAFDAGGVRPEMRGYATSERSQVCRSAAMPSSDSQILDTWLALMRSIPIVAATRSIFLVDAPQVAISDAAAMTARSMPE